MKEIKQAWGSLSQDGSGGFKARMEVESQIPSEICLKGTGNIVVLVMFYSCINAMLEVELDII